MQTALVAVATAYSLLMLALFPTLVPRLYEPKSKRPDLLRATWVAAALIPLIPVTPLSLPLLPLSTLLAKRGSRKASLLSTIPAVAHAILILYAALLGTPPAPRVS